MVTNHGVLVTRRMLQRWMIGRVERVLRVQLIERRVVLCVSLLLR